MLAGRAAPGSEVIHLGDLYLEAVEVTQPDVHLLTALTLHAPLRAVQMVCVDAVAGRP